MSEYIIGKQPTESVLKFDSNTGKLKIQNKNNDEIIIKTPGEIIPLNAFSVSGNTVSLNNDYNCYIVKPTATTNLVFNNDDVNQYTGGEFYLMLDFTDGVQTVTFPDTFQWKNNTSIPSMCAQNLYIFKCLYLYTDPIAYTGEFITSVINSDYQSKIWAYMYGTSLSLYARYRIHQYYYNWYVNTKF